MADKTPDQEPSIEEILASIRQIISDDDDKDDAPQMPQAAPVVADVPVPPIPPKKEPEYVAPPEPVIEDDEDDILELTTPIFDEPETVVPDEDFDSIDLEEFTPEIEEAPAFVPEPQIAPVPPRPAQNEQKAAPMRPEAPQPKIDSDILSETARQAAIHSMARLTGNMPIGRPRDTGSVTIEDLVRDLLNPMLRDWLSENLPPMVERMVQKELEKLARQAQDV